MLVELILLEPEFNAVVLHTSEHEPILMSLQPARLPGQFPRWGYYLVEWGLLE